MVLRRPRTHPPFERAAEAFHPGVVVVPVHVRVPVAPVHVLEEDAEVG